MDETSLTVRSSDGFSSHCLIGSGVSVTGISLGVTVTIVGAGQPISIEA